LKRIVNTVKKDNSTRKLKTIAKAFSAAIKEIDDPRTWEVDYMFFVVVLQVDFVS